jgi:hypothetical protein
MDQEMITKLNATVGGVTAVAGVLRGFRRANRWLAVTAAMVGMIAVSAAAEAQTTTFDFMVSGSCGGESCSAYAAITPGNGTLTVVLTDEETNPLSAGALLSAIRIATSSSPGTPTLLSQNGALVDIGSKGSVKSVAGNPTHWGVGVSGSQILLETAGTFSAGGQPIDQIIGPPGPHGYTNANGSINSHDPYISGSGTFVLIDSAITSATTMVSVAFGFGTTPDTFLTGVPATRAPEPTSLALLATALGGLVCFARRRTTRRPVFSPAWMHPSGERSADGRTPGRDRQPPSAA